MYPIFGLKVRAALLLTMLVALFVSAPAARANDRIAKADENYLALGDSLAYGYHQAQFASQFPNINAASFNDGYVDDFSAMLGREHRRTLNEGCPGETSDSLINGYVFTGNPSSSLCAYGSGFLYAWLHHPYAYKSQLDDAAAFLQTRRNAKETSPITIDIGANDTLRYLNSCQPTNSCTAAGVQGVYGQIVTNLDTILTRLQAIAPKAGYVVLGLYNPYPAVINIGGVSGDQATASLNALEKQVAAAHGAAFADPLPVFNPSGSAGGSELGDIPTICAYTAMCPGGSTPFPLGYNPLPGTPGSAVPADIHPTALGYQKLADAIFAATGYKQKRHRRHWNHD